MNVKGRTTGLMAIQQVTKHGITHPFGDHRTVKQAFPSAIPSEQSDPFLMCDYFDMKETKGKAKHEDDFPVGWHPHQGMDIASYLKKGMAAMPYFADGGVPGRRREGGDAGAEGHDRHPEGVGH